MVNRKDNQIDKLFDIYRAKEISDINDILPEISNIENVFNGLFNITKQFIYIFDLFNLDYYYIGEGIENLIGYTPDETKGKGLKYVFYNIHPDDRDIVEYIESNNIKYFKKHPFKGNKVRTHFDYRFKSKNGKYLRLLQENSILKYNDKGEPLFSIGLVKNITKQKNTTHILSCINGPGARDKIVQVFIPGEEVKPVNLTLRECDILEALAKGYNTKDTAKLLNLSPHTIDTYRKKIQEKTKTKNTSELVSLGICNKII